MFLTFMFDTNNYGRVHSNIEAITTRDRFCEGKIFQVSQLIVRVDVPLTFRVFACILESKSFHADRYAGELVSRVELETK